MRSREQWNHNSHYHDWLLRRLPSRFEHALDVGCGLGFFAVRLADAGARVHAIDANGDVLAEASKLHPLTHVAFQEGDFLSMRLPSDTYDVVTSIAALHHMDLRGALSEMKRVLRPGGQLAVLGLYRGASSIDHAVSLVAMVPNLLRTHAVARGSSGNAARTAPTRAPASSLPEIRRSASAVLPGARVARHLYWRYSLLWHKPLALEEPTHEVFKNGRSDRFLFLRPAAD